MLKRALRAVVPAPLWRALHRARTRALYTARFGRREGRTLYRALHGDARGEVTVAVPGLPAPLTLRAGTSDVDAFEQVFVLGEYDVRLPTPPRTVIDGGANVGAAAVYFAHRYPEARIAAVEPDPENVDLLRRNVALYPGVRPIQAGLWALLNPADRPWDRRVGEGAGGIPALTVEDVMDALGGGPLDLLKLDIEGAEVEVFRSSAAWIGRVGTIIVETHDALRPGCADALRAATRDEGFARHRSGENEVLTRHGGLGRPDELSTPEG